VLRDQLLKVHGVAIYVSAGLPRPLPAMIRTWTRTHQHKDIDASPTALENALATRQQNASCAAQLRPVAAGRRSGQRVDAEAGCAEVSPPPWAAESDRSIPDSLIIR